MKRAGIIATAALAALLWFTQGVVAQDAPIQTAPVPLSTAGQATTGPEVQPPLRAPIVTLDRDRLFEGSMMGQALARRFEAASNDLIAENRQLEQALEQEERDLTERRKTMAAEEFRALATEFDTRVEALRQAQDVKSRSLTRQRDEDRQQFFQAAIPILGQLMSEIEAVAIVDRSAIILTFDRLDITDLAIERLDATLGDGQSVLDPAPQTNTAPQAPQDPDAPDPGAVGQSVPDSGQADTSAKP